MGSGRFPANSGACWLFAPPHWERCAPWGAVLDRAEALASIGSVRDTIRRPWRFDSVRTLARADSRQGFTTLQEVIPHAVDVHA